jgi:Holliday junction resolvase RusA-like endonuclease
MYLLPPISNLSEGQLELNLTFGFSSRASDLSNPLKMTEDILTKKYGFNDNRIYRIVMEKKIVSKGEEYLQFLIKKYEQKE